MGVTLLQHRETVGVFDVSEWDAVEHWPGAEIEQVERVVDGARCLWRCAYRPNVDGGPAFLIALSIKAPATRADIDDLTKRAADDFDGPSVAVSERLQARHGRR